MLKILIIDDDKFVHKYISKALAGHYEPFSAFNGEEGLARALEITPDFILLDVEMPGMNGYEVCDHIKRQQATAQIPVIFLSGLGSTKERLLGYEAGGIDYMTKPFETKELLTKLNLLTDTLNKEQELQSRAKTAEVVAHTAMTDSSDLGQIVQLAQESYTHPNFAMVAKKQFQFYKNLELRSCIMITDDQGEQHFFSSSGQVQPLEQEIMPRVQHNSRFFDFGCRTQINYPNISALIKNMPLDNPERYGRIKDILPAALGVADVRVRELCTRDLMLQQAQDMMQSFYFVQTTLEELSSQLQSNQVKSEKVLRSMVMDMIQKLPRLGLEDDQEKYLLDSLEDTVQETITITDASEDITNSFNRILKALESLVEKQVKNSDIYFKLGDQITPLATFDIPSEDDSFDIELF